MVVMGYWGGPLGAQGLGWNWKKEIKHHQDRVGILKNNIACFNCLGLTETCVIESKWMIFVPCKCVFWHSIYAGNFPKSILFSLRCISGRRSVSRGALNKYFPEKGNGKLWHLKFSQIHGFSTFRCKQLVTPRCKATRRCRGVLRFMSGILWLVVPSRPLCIGFFFSKKSPRYIQVIPPTRRLVPEGLRSYRPSTHIIRP